MLAPRLAYNKSKGHHKTPDPDHKPNRSACQKDAKCGSRDIARTAAPLLNHRPLPVQASVVVPSLPYSYLQRLAELLVARRCCCQRRRDRIGADSLPGQHVGTASHSPPPCSRCRTSRWLPVPPPGRFAAGDRQHVVVGGGDRRLRFLPPAPPGAESAAAADSATRRSYRCVRSRRTLHFLLAMAGWWLLTVADDF